MTTAFKVKGKGKMISFVTQQYTLGLYVAIYTEGDPIPQQTGSEAKELDFHRNLRKTIKESGDTFIKEESDPLNRSECIQAQNEFVMDYCKRKGWPLSKTPHRGLELLSKRQVQAIKARPELKALANNLVWE